MCHSARLYNCARCGCQVVICRHCDRGNYYCNNGCAQLSRYEKVKQAQKRYEQTAHAKALKSQRQKKYRQRKKEKATDQGSITLEPYDLLIELEKLKIKVKKWPFIGNLSIYCHFCGSRCSDYLRFVFLEHSKPHSFSAL